MAWQSEEREALEAIYGDDFVVRGCATRLGSVMELVQVTSESGPFVEMFVRVRPLLHLNLALTPAYTGVSDATSGESDDGESLRYLYLSGTSFMSSVDGVCCCCCGFELTTSVVSPDELWNVGIIGITIRAEVSLLQLCGSSFPEMLTTYSNSAASLVPSIGTCWSAIDLSESVI